MLSHIKNFQYLLIALFVISNAACTNPLQKTLNDLKKELENNPEVKVVPPKDTQPPPKPDETPIVEPKKPDSEDELPYETKDGYRILDEGLEVKIESRSEFLFEQLIYEVNIFRIHPEHSKIKIVSYQEDPAAYKTPKALREYLNAKLVVNGGFFPDTKTPNIADGLLMLDGKKISDPNPKLSGVLAIQENILSIIETDKFKIEDMKADTSAIQGTPRLIERGGKIGIEKPDLKTTKDKRLMRTAICTLKNNDILIMVTSTAHSGLYLYEMAAIAKDAGCDIALNLDGGPATGVSTKRYKRQADNHYFTFQLENPAQLGWIHPNHIVIE